MDRRHFLSALPAAALALQAGPPALAQATKKGIMLMNRIGPSTSDLYIAAADGTGERRLFKDSNFDIGGVRKAFSKAGEVFALLKAEKNLTLVTPDAPHDFPDAERKVAYEWLDRLLK